MQRVSSQRRFKRLVVFRERTFRHLIKGKQTSHAFLLHDKRPYAAARRRCAVVRNIPAGPLSAVPFQQLTLRIPRVTLRICGGAVIQNAAVKRPCPCPAQRVTEARRIGVITTRHLVAFWRPATGKNPAATGGCTVIAQLSERAKLLAFLDNNRTGCRIGNIGQRLTVALHRHFFRLRLMRDGVVPGHVQHLVRVRATLFGIHLAQAQEDTGEDLAISQRNPRGVRTFPVPLQPATRVND